MFPFGTVAVCARCCCHVPVSASLQNAAVVDPLSRRNVNAGSSVRHSLIVLICSGKGGGGAVACGGAAELASAINGTTTDMPTNPPKRQLCTSGSPSPKAARLFCGSSPNSLRAGEKAA